MKQKGKKLRAATVEEWLDCGNKDATVFTNNRMLEIKKGAAANLATPSDIKKFSHHSTLLYWRRCED
jgi:glucose-1-phosphate thymidylyltransferase